MKSAAACLVATETDLRTWSADSLEDEKDELRSAFVSFNDFINELARAWRYEEGTSRRYKFDRAQVAEQIDDIPKSLTGRQKIVDRLWTLIGQAEREISQDELDTLVKDALVAVDGSDVNRTERLIAKIQTLVSDGPWLKGAANLEKLETAHLKLVEDQATEKRRVEFQKLLTKADKFAFLEEVKKAAKAYQECLFWLTRNDLPDKGQIERDTRGKLETAQACLAK